ncbi:hypothetical protein BOQ62_14760 [Chryseobacterium sp. CH21]|uniref:methyltransferase domain-containing protein n=1 Tax=Chryseobacterium sp. CH21 TaxID=713556 RepID=UPI00100A6FB1|nr:class I SAM-dependent methyltransferase [Chryseobacterium sp. CH21]RXM38941.1 hypothetical protein BOQ62_14760 [Chryseobacterium sp. CH21]
MDNKTLIDQNQSTWESFWKKNPTGFDSIMKQATLYFAKTLNKKYPIQPDDHILDLGCGPGFLIDYLKDKCELIHGIDISEKYIEICKEQYKDQKNLSISVNNSYDHDGYNQIIVEKKINKVIMLSVLQYYKDLDEVRNLILYLKKVSGQQSFRCILADIIPENNSVIADLKSIIKNSVGKGHTIDFIKFLFYVFFSDYRNTKKNGMLHINESFFTNLGQELDLKVQIVKNLTVHSGRYSVIIDY